MNYDVIVKELPAMDVLSMRCVIPDFHAIYKIYPEMDKYLEEKAIKRTTPSYRCIIYHDGEYKEKDIDVEFCQAVVGSGQDTDKFKFKKLKAVAAAACAIHKGPYNTIGMAHSAIGQWIKDNGYEIAGNLRESYIDSLWNKKKLKDWITEIQIPIRPKHK